MRLAGMTESEHSRLHELYGAGADADWEVLNLQVVLYLTNGADDGKVKWRAAQHALMLLRRILRVVEVE
jgi:hypothetical protein